MKKYDGLKIEIDYLKSLYQVSLVAFFSMVSYLFINYESMPKYKIYLLPVGIFITLSALSYFEIKIRKNIKEIKRIENEPQ